MLASVTSFMYSVGKALEWTFETFLVPVADPFNWAVFALGLVCFVFWLRLQVKYNTASKNNSTIK